MCVWAAEIKLRAERRAGGMLKEMERRPRGATKKERSHDVTLPPTLKDIGISKMQSSRWQQEAAVPDFKTVRGSDHLFPDIHGNPMAHAGQGNSE